MSSNRPSNVAVIWHRCCSRGDQLIHQDLTDKWTASSDGSVFDQPGPVPIPPAVSIAGIANLVPGQLQNVRDITILGKATSIVVHNEEVGGVPPYTPYSGLQYI